MKTHPDEFRISISALECDVTSRRRKPVAPDLGIAPFRNRNLGSDIYCIGAGGSLNYLDRTFFDDKIVVAVNEIASRWGVHADYGICKEEGTLLEIAPLGYPIMASRHDSGYHAHPPRSMASYPQFPNLTIFEHEDNRAEAFDAYAHWPTDPNALLVSMSTITTGMHFAAHLGARFIFVVGHDCGQLGETDYVTGYTAPVGEWKEPWLVAIEKQSLAVKRELLRRYAPTLRGIYSVSPFLSPNLDGVPYRGANRINLW